MKTNIINIKNHLQEYIDFLKDMKKRKTKQVDINAVIKELEFIASFYN